MLILKEYQFTRNIISINSRQKFLIFGLKTEHGLMAVEDVLMTRVISTLRYEGQSQIGLLFIFYVIIQILLSVVK